MPCGLISVLVLVNMFFFPSAHLKGVCFQHKILMPVELATKTTKRTSKQMTSNSPCTSIALGFGNPANSAEVGVEGCDGGFFASTLV